MIMLEEFRRRKNVKTYIEARTKLAQKENAFEPEAYDYKSNILGKYEARYKGIGPERYFEHQMDEIYDSSKFTLIFMDSDSVTNVTRLNRVN